MPTHPMPHVRTRACAHTRAHTHTHTHTHTQVAIDARESNGSVANIAQLDMVKRNVESASSTLAEAAELSSLFVKVGCARMH